MMRNPDRCPTHPGVFLREIVVPEVDVSKTEIARRLGISRQQLYAILNGEQPVTSATAVKLEALFGRSAQAWLNMQTAHDVWHAKQTVDVSHVKPLRAAP